MVQVATAELVRPPRLRVALLTLLGCLAVESTLIADDSVGDDEAALRATVERATARLQQSAQLWAMTQSCTSCHHQGLGALAAAVVVEKGMVADRAKLGVQSERILYRLRERLGQHAFGMAGSNPAIGESYSLVALSAAGRPGETSTDAIVHALAGLQSTDGRWTSVEHQPPLEDSSITATALTVRALIDYPLAGRAEEMSERIGRAREWLAAAAPRDTEEHVFRLLGLDWASSRDGRPDRRHDRLIDEGLETLRQLQNEDGGWSQIASRASDAYATGQALVVLQQLGAEPVDGGRYQEGVRFLMSELVAGESWHVPSRRTVKRRPHFDSGFPHGEDQFISYAGTAWATMALSFAVEPGPARALTADPRGRAPKTTRTALDPVIDAALFGSLDDLKSAAKGVATPVSAVGPYALTPLIAALHDQHKVRWLLAQGADPEANTVVGLRAIHVASYYSGAIDSLRLLLDAGVTPERPTNLGLLPIYLAAISGRIDSIEALLEHGATLDRWSVDEKVPDPLTIAVRRQHEPLVAFLLDSRPEVALVETEDSIPPLSLAVLGRSTTLVERLLAAGADPMQTDREGRTALHWAVVADAGTQEILDRLIAHGADPTATDLYGRTPVELATVHGHHHLARALSPSAAP